MSCKTEGATHHNACECREKLFESDLANLRSENERLREEAEVLIWNLAGCSTFALGYGIDEPFNVTMARPAMFDVLNVRKQLNAAEEALSEIANIDYRGHRSTESCLAFAALAKLKEIRGTR